MILATAPIELCGIWIQSPPTLALRATGFVPRVSRWEICAWHSRGFSSATLKCTYWAIIVESYFSALDYNLH